MHSVNSSIQEEILRLLHSAELEHDVKIHYACESGSRAWGAHRRIQIMI